MTTITQPDILIVRYLNSKRQVAVPSDVPYEEVGYESNLDVMKPKFEKDSPDGPGYETSVYYYDPKEGIDWEDGIATFKKGGNPEVPAFAHVTNVGAVMREGLYVASQPLCEGSRHASIRGWSADPQLMREQYEDLAVNGECAIRPDMEGKMMNRARSIWTQQHPTKDDQ